MNKANEKELNKPIDIMTVSEELKKQETFV